jgi:hypothetical protein
MGVEMNTKDRAMRIESVRKGNEIQDDCKAIRLVLEKQIEITEHLLGYFRTLIEFEDRDRAKEQERIGNTSEGSDISKSAGSETQTGNSE